MTSDAADREKQLAADLVDAHRKKEMGSTASAILRAIRSELAAHEQAHHGTGTAFVCDGTCAGTELGDCSHPQRKPPAADRPAVDVPCGGRKGWCIRNDPPPGNVAPDCDCGASDPKAGGLVDKRVVPSTAEDADDRFCDGCLQYRATVDDTGRCAACRREVIEPPPAPDRKAPKPPERMKVAWHPMDSDQVWHWSSGDEAGGWQRIEVVPLSALTEALGVLGAMVETQVREPCDDDSCQAEVCKVGRRARALLARHGVKS